MFVTPHHLTKLKKRKTIQTIGSVQGLAFTFFRFYRVAFSVFRVRFFAFHEFEKSQSLVEPLPHISMEQIVFRDRKTRKNEKTTLKKRKIIAVEPVLKAETGH